MSVLYDLTGVVLGIWWMFSRLRIPLLLKSGEADTRTGIIEAWTPDFGSFPESIVNKEISVKVPSSSFSSIFSDASSNLRLLS